MGYNLGNMELFKAMEREREREEKQVKVKEWRRHELYATLPTGWKPCPDFVSGP